MATDSRPAKRLRRSITILSDDEDQNNNTSNHSPRSVPKVNSTLSSPTKPLTKRPKKSSASPSAKTSPEKARKHVRIKSEDAKNKSLHNFFSKATEEERWHKRSYTPDIETNSEILDDDIVDDGSDVEESSKPVKTDAVRERINGGRNHSGLDAVSSSQNKAHLPSSQRFLKPPIPKHQSSGSDIPIQAGETEELHRPWADRYGPVNLDELAVHKKKVADVGNWFDEALSGRSRQRVLVLKGPAGCGKTVTVQLLAQTKNLVMVTWQNPTVSERGTLSTSLQFGEFLSRGGEYEALSLGTEQQNQPNAPSGRRFLLIEDFPSSVTRSSSALESFRSALLRYSAGHGPNLQFKGMPMESVNPPVVIIVSETLVSSATAVFDSFTAHRLLGPELSNHPSVTVIEFNPVAPTFIAKALDLVVKKEARDSKRRRIPGHAVMQKLTEVGDIRSAVNSLEFLCARGDDNAEWSGTVAANIKRGSKATLTLTEMEENTLKLVSQRETTLDMFHATGKVVYNKREDPRFQNPKAELPPKPPDHLMHTYSSKVSQVDVEALLNETGTDIQTFVSTLHENYILSCNGGDFVDHFADCSQNLSDTDLLNPDSRNLGRSKSNARGSHNSIQFGTSDSLRQDEISFQVATRGLLFSLPHPVSRAIAPGARKSDSFKMFYPASLRLWKPTEEIYDLIKFQAQQLPNAASMSGYATTRNEGVASWKDRIGSFNSRSTVPGAVEAEDTLNTTPRTDASVETLVLELLPYTTKIRACHEQDVTVLNKITQLRGIYLPTEDSFDEDLEELNNTGARLTQKVEAVHSLLAQRTTKNLATRMFGKESISNVSGTESRKQTEPPIEDLFIEDDDIEDD